MEIATQLRRFEFADLGGLFWCILKYTCQKAKLDHSTTNNKNKNIKPVLSGKIMRCRDDLQCHFSPQK
jgi:hypothetical protein